MIGGARAVLLASALAFSSLACGSGGGATSQTQSAPGGCEVTTVGPLVGYTYRLGPQPQPLGGPVADGFYDLVEIVDHTRATGEWSSNNAPAHRWALRFATEERSPNHVQGRLTMMLDLPPSASCRPGRFATFQTQLRITDAQSKLEAMDYSASGDQVVLMNRGMSYTFRRRR